MKKIFTLTIICSLFASAVIGQTKAEKEKILNSYDKSKTKALEKLITNNDKERTKRIDEFLNLNSGYKLLEKFNGKSYQIIDIIDGKPMYISTDNIASAEATRTNFLHNGGGLGLDIEGQDMTIGVWEENHPLITHDEYSSTDFLIPTRVSTPDFLTGGSYDDHATHVTGTLIGNGSDSFARGMAPQASAVAYDWTTDSNEVLTEASTNALLLSNHSYGVPVLTSTGAQNAPTWVMGCYNSDAVLWDNIAYDHPYYLQVLSAGNDGQSTYSGGLAFGYDKLTTNKNCKNNLVVANANNPSVSGSGDLLSLSINASSSQGPTDDGRIKPDIAGDGTNVYSALSNNDQSYGFRTGTSMSSPNVAGSLLLLQQYYNSINSQYMKASTLKGLVCHTADDDNTKVGPDPIFGWGLLNAKSAAETILNNSTGEAIISELTLSEGETYTITFSTSASGPISATICWTDPAGANQSGVTNSPIPALVNDLDLRLEAPDGFTIHFPWKLSLSNVAGAATTGDNIVDTVEKIDIDTPSAGTYTLTVTHKGTLTNGSQDYSLIVTGSDLTLSTNENTLSDFMIWPNPASGVLNFRFNSLNNGSTLISLIDLQGRKVYSDSLNSNSSVIQGSIETSNFAQGIYLLQVKQGNAITNKRVIIK